MTDVLTTSDEPASDAGERRIRFLGPLIGFPRSTHFVLRRMGGRYEPFCSLDSLDEEGLTFVVVPPGELFDDYVVEVPAPDVALLGLEASEDVEVLVLVTSRRGATPTANLMGPIVVNRRTLDAAQLVLADSAYPVAVPVDAGSARGGSARASVAGVC